MRSQPVEALSVLHEIRTALLPAAEGGVPEMPGIYAWWVDPEALPEVPAALHPSESLGLLYVGIAPKRATSRATLRSRLLKQHVGGNVGSSTFRRSLAALLFERQGWVPVRTAAREKLTPGDNAALSNWQRAHLRLAWLPVDQPWTAEGAIIEGMQPALNLEGNSAHPFYAEMSDARRRFKNAAG